MNNEEDSCFLTLILWFTQMVASKRLQQAQAQVGEVVDIMRVNVEKVLERDQKLSELDRRADDLQEGASQFQQQESTERLQCN